VTNAKERVRFLGYDIKRGDGRRILKVHTITGTRTKRTVTYQLELLMPREKSVKFAQTYGDLTTWKGKHRGELMNLSELEILLMYNAEVRGFLGYYALADNLKYEASKILWLTNTSFFRTLAGKRQSTVKKVMKSMKRGPGSSALAVREEGKEVKMYDLLASTKQLKTGMNQTGNPDLIANVQRYQSRTELGKRLLANQCEWCGTKQGLMEVHHVRKLKDLKGKTLWERRMIERRRKTTILCAECHHELHAGTLSSKKKAKGKLESQLH
jgi:hypothetical protein